MHVNSHNSLLADDPFRVGILGNFKLRKQKIINSVSENESLGAASGYLAIAQLYTTAKNTKNILQEAWKYFSLRFWQSQNPEIKLQYYFGGLEVGPNTPVYKNNFQKSFLRQLGIILVFYSYIHRVFKKNPHTMSNYGQNAPN